MCAYNLKVDACLITVVVEMRLVGGDRRLRLEPLSGSLSLSLTCYIEDLNAEVEVFPCNLFLLYNFDF